jgi:DNA-binding CsgD family transcriptional regulator
MPLKKYILSLIFLISGFIFSQQKELQEVKFLMKKGDFKNSILKIDSLLNDKNNSKIKGELNLEKAKIYRIRGKNKLFEKQLLLAEKIAAKNENLILQADILLQKHLYFKVNKSEQLTFLVKYIAIAEKTQNKKLLFNAYLKLTATSLQGDNVEKAKIYHKKAANYYKKWKNTNILYSNLNLLSARIYNVEEKQDSVIFYLQKTLKQLKQEKRKRGFPQIYYLLGDAEQKKKNYTQSFNWLSKSYKLSTKIDNKRFKEISYANLFSLLNKVSQQKNDSLFRKIVQIFNATSLRNATENIEIELENIKRTSSRQLLLNTLNNVYDNLGDYKKALYYKQKWSNLTVERAYNEQLNVTNFMNLELAMSNLNKEKKALEIENELSFTHKVILSLLIIIVFILGLFFWYKQKLKTKTEKLSKMTAERNLLKETKEKIELEKILTDKELELNAFIRDMIEKNSQIKILEEQLKNSKSNNIEDLETIKFSASKNWSQFVFKFKQLHPNFLEKLKKLNTTISPTETKLSILVFLNLTSKEIADLLNISPSSVNQGKYRLKKKLNIDKEKSITQFFQEL